MRFRVKDLDIATGGILVVVLNQEDAHKLDLSAGDRVLVKNSRGKTVAIVDIAESSKHIKRGQAGCFEEVLDKVGVVDGDNVDITFARKPDAIHFIREKLDGKKLPFSALNSIISSVVEDELTDGELTYFVSACFARGMSIKEIIDLTRSIVLNGDRLNFDRPMVLDKHCSGGIPGNRTTMLIVPIIAAAGFTIPKTSSRGITSAAGTADVMEVLAKVTLPVSEIKKVVNKTNGCIVWGGGMNLASADDKLIRVRQPLSIDPDGMLISSIMAKKMAVSATHILIDLPIGRHTKIKTKAQANRLKQLFRVVGKQLKMKTYVVTTNGQEPIGNGIGPVLEARDVLYVLRRDNKRPLDLERKAILLSGKLLEIAGIKNGVKRARELVESGLAYAKMREIIKAQGGNPHINPDKLRLGRYSCHVRATKSGRITDINTKSIARIARIAGAPLDKPAGIYLYKHEKDRVKKGDLLFTIYSESEEKLEFAKDVYRRFKGINIR